MLPHGLVASDPWLLLARARRLAAEGALTEAVAAFRLAHAAAEDSQLAARCLEEARTAALWLPDADPVARTWAATIRAATQRNPRTLLPGASDLPGAEGRLAAGVVALLAGDLGVAAGLLREAADHPDADIGVVAPAACASRVVGLLAGAPSASTTRAPTSRRSCWTPRWGLAVAVPHRARAAGDRRPGSAPAVEPCDPWGAAVVSFVGGLGGRAAGPLRDAATRFTELGAPVPAQWAACLAAAAAVARDERPGSGATRTGPDRGRAGPGDGAAGSAGRGARPGRRGPRRAPSRARGSPPSVGGDAAATGSPRSHCTCSAAPRSRSTATAVDLSTVRPRARSTLRLLALRAGNAVHRDVLVASLWPDVDEEAALRSLQVAISSLRSVLGGRTRSRSTLLARNGESYCLQLPPGSRSDVLDFDARLADARTRRHDGDAAAERAALAAALGHYGGDLLPEEGAAEWVVAERDRLRIAAAGAWCALGRRLGDDGDFSEAVDAVRAGLRLDAYSDDGWRLLVDLHTRAGNPAAAQAAALEHAQVLAELGVEPEVRVAPS